jgi:hypothetical protein
MNYEKLLFPLIILLVAAANGFPAISLEFENILIPCIEAKHENASNNSFSRLTSLSLEAYIYCHR